MDKRPLKLPALKLSLNKNTTQNASQNLNPPPLPNTQDSSKCSQQSQDTVTSTPTPTPTPTENLQNSSQGSSQNSQPKLTLKLKLPQKPTTTTTTTTTSSSSSTLKLNLNKNNNNNNNDTSKSPPKIQTPICTNLGDNTYLIKGYKVKFPYEPYECQSTMISHILESLDNSTHCVLESATGTGKTLTLLAKLMEKMKNQQKKVKIDPQASATTPLDDLQTSQISQQLADKLQTDFVEFKDALNRFGHLNNNNNSNDNANGLKRKTMDDGFDEFVSQYKYNPNKIKNENNNNMNNDFDEFISQYKYNPNKNNENNNNNNNGNGNVDNIEDNEDSFKAPPVPTIFYCSRTHSQIKQLTKELKKTVYQPNMLVLGSRDHYCVNPELKNIAKKKERCMKLIRDSGCKFVKNTYSIAKSSKFKAGGELAVWDIEDLILEGKKTRECPFFASKDMIEFADLIFCPYNYLIDPSIRKAFKKKVKNSIVIFDEAHNVEDAFMDAASFNVSLEELFESYQQIRSTLENPTLYNDLTTKHPTRLQSMTYIFRQLEKINTWFKKKLASVEKVDFEKYALVLEKKDDILSALEEMGVSKFTFPDLETNIAMLSSELDLKKGDDFFGNKGDVLYEFVSPKTVILLDSFVKSIKFIFERDYTFLKDYKLVIQKNSVFVPTGKGQSGTKWAHTLGIWAMSPRVAFSSLIFDQVRTVILTSGTLTPLNSFAFELSAPFPITAELGNLSDIKSRVWINTLGFAGQNDQIKMDCTSKPSESLQFQDALGEAILEHCKLIPHGVLLFFPSYGFLDKIEARWKSTKLYDRLNNVKKIFRERSSNFKETLSDYYVTIRDNPPGRDGAILMAVCRGKISEGIDFSDEYARGVIVVGIPYPNLGDIKVKLKKAYNDTIKQQEQKAIDGHYWYNLQAFRALNQAIGRCIRHRNDYGSILLVDERYSKSLYSEKLSKWARVCLQNNLKCTKSLESLSQFYKTKDNLRKTK
ncbi:DEAD/DEAH box helicase [Tieghemostelium lacteum]|uniref:Regulator of telomere elongation helicase 1 homolog n=1 Tax=Tieghemostelium lacteum TaxID=361077 RepID=A0A151ZGG8_TIELA|nr:DEAD/DEAH box helicase [Tieghemostelium lacteum]|eukprot:KYQ92970.1 DEAD/DEAH box helicase [Tieghemostelium lacteum]